MPLDDGPMLGHGLVMTSLTDFARQKLATLDDQGLRRSLAVTEWHDGVTAIRDGKRLVSFCSNDYLNLARHPAVLAAASEALRTHGAGAGSSRLVTGNHVLYPVLETRLAALKGTEAAIVFGSGYLANLSIVPTLAGPGDLLLVDEWAHSCILAGMHLSGATRSLFRHNDLDDLERVLRAERGRHRHCLIVTDRVFSMDGDLAPIEGLARLAARFEAWLMTDDAHGTGILPPLDPEQVPLQMGTLSKALGSYGGYLCAPRAVVDLMYSRARGFVYTTGLPPASVAAAVAALDVIAADPVLASRPIQNARTFAAACGLPEPTSQIVPVIMGSAARAVAVSSHLADAGYLVPAIRPPTVPEGTARLRLTFSAAHQEADLAGLVAALRPHLAESFR